MRNNLVMNRNFALGVVLLGALISSSPSTPAFQQGANSPPHAVSERVGKLFSKMREGKYDKYTATEFPDLRWQDIPALLELGGSKRILKDFPDTSISSILQEECSEGMIALWLVEGIRLGGKQLPSLNPLITPLKSGEDYQRQSENHHAQVLAAYQKWWNRVNSLPLKQAMKVDPLAKTGLAWFGPRPR